MESEKSNPQAKTILVTGATSGIGKATAKYFAKKGYNVIITGRRENLLDQFSKELSTKYAANVKTLCFDVTAYEDAKNKIESLQDGWQNIDILVNNAGGARGFEPINEGKIEDWDYMIDANIKGLLYITKLIAPKMIERKKGHIINLGSLAGKEVYPNGGVYCASKHAVEALTKAMRHDFFKHGIRVSQIAPGMVEETEFALNRFHGDAERAKIYEGFTPLNSRDVAEIIFFIATRAKHINIQDILVMSSQQASGTLIERNGRK